MDILRGGGEGTFGGLPRTFAHADSFTKFQGVHSSLKFLYGPHEL